LKNLIVLVCRIAPDTVTASSGDSLPVVAGRCRHRFEFHSGAVGSGQFPADIYPRRGLTLARQRQKRQHDPNDRSHKTYIPETIMSSSSASPPRPPID
jgi:hypothetical protein